MQSRTGRLAAALFLTCSMGLSVTLAGPASARAGAPGAVSGEPSTPRWVLGHLPPGGALDGGNVVHTLRKGETWQSVAEEYLELTSVYDPGELAKAIVSANLPASKKGPAPGTTIVIPHVLPAAPKNGRLGLPKEDVVRGIYVRGSTAGGHGYPALLDRVVAHGMNAIVLDVKDYDGLVTYPSRVAMANDIGAVDKPPIRSYARAVRFAHDKGVRVIARVSCFNDQTLSKAHPSMAIRGISGHPYRNGWVDPKNEQVHAYLRELVNEAIDAGADEIQLDYVRFPVIGMKNIDYGLDTRKNPRAKVEVIDGFVESVHRITQHRGLPLSLDVFGVIAFGKDVDIQNLGQDPSELSTRAEYLSAMVYPSHYDPGFMGFEAPGDHPELVGMGVKHMLREMSLRADPEPRAKIRPWLQAMRHKSSNYGASYIQNEILTGNRAGGAGWLLWNPGQVYDVAWSALPRKSGGKNLAHKHRTQ